MRETNERTQNQRPLVFAGRRRLANIGVLHDPRLAQTISRTSTSRNPPSRPRTPATIFQLDFFANDWELGTRGSGDPQRMLSLRFSPQDILRLRHTRADFIATVVTNLPHIYAIIDRNMKHLPRRQLRPLRQHSTHITPFKAIIVKKPVKIGFDGISELCDG